MKRTLKKLLAVALCALIGLSGGAFVACGGDGNEIKVCASEIPHAEILNGKVKDLLAEKGYKLTVTVLDWTIQNDSVANGDYDANYFQHIPYLSLYTGRTSLSATCKVHYEPLGIYYGKAAKGTAVTDGTSFIICADESNGVRALELLKANGVFSETSEGDNYPITSDNRFNFQGETWTSASGVTVTLIPEENLAGALSDYDFACLPCNTALTGNIGSDKRAAVESDPAQVGGKANVLAVRTEDYKNNSAYKAKIDALTDALLSADVAAFVVERYSGIILCNENTQIDLRQDIK